MLRSGTSRAVGALCLLLGVAACSDELPTAIGPDQFPDGTLFTTGVLELPASGFLEVLGQFEGYTGVANAQYMLAANRFEDALEAHALIRLAEFPDSVVYFSGGTSITDTSFVYAASRLVATIDSAATAVEGTVTLRVVALTQDWDPGSATWTHATDTTGAWIPWTQPGGALGEELARTIWSPQDTIFRDSVVWQVDSLAVARMAVAGFPGIAVLAEGNPARVQLGGFALHAGIRPGSRPDTVITHSVAGAAYRFIFTPELPQPANDWHAGGLTAKRTVLRLTLPDSVDGCPQGPPASGTCRRHALSRVTLNEAALLIEPRPVGGGFRPLTPRNVRLRIVADVNDPARWRRAPLGRVVSESVLQPALFAAPADTVLQLPLTEFVAELLARDTSVVRASTPLALLSEPEDAAFGHARFAPAARLRIVYTLPAPRVSP